MDFVRQRKDFLAQSFRECPTITFIGVVFSAISFSPHSLDDVALTLIICFLAASGILVAVVALASGALLAIVTLAVLLSTFLSVALAFSAFAALAKFGVIWFRTPKIQTQEAAPAAPPPLKRAFAALRDRAHVVRHPMKPSWQSYLVVFLLSRNPLARIVLPRWMRYTTIYPYVFGRNRSPHPLKWVLLRRLHGVVAVASFLLTPVRILSHIGWDSVLIVCALVLFLSPGVRSWAYSSLALGVAKLRPRKKKPPVETGRSDPGTDQETPAAEIVTAVSSLVPQGQAAATTAVSTLGISGGGMRARNGLGADGYDGA
ncbi:hypothetical protein B0H14DRAFT_2732088 [Mycena olivaceomarginata]|nr:hypothetical protein B0H14DRAFT_2732088 [Mycena olivaceomarginata]